MSRDEQTTQLLAYLNTYACTQPREELVAIARKARSELEEILEREEHAQSIPVVHAMSAPAPTGVPEPEMRAQDQFAQRRTSLIERMQNTVHAACNALTRNARAIATAGAITLGSVLALYGVAEVSERAARAYEYRSRAPIVQIERQPARAAQEDAAAHTPPTMALRTLPPIRARERIEETPIVPRAAISAPPPTAHLLVHEMDPVESRYTISPQRLVATLDHLRINEYHLATFGAYASGHARHERQAVLTFDDSSASQFRILPSGRIDPTSLVGVLDAYQRKHPSFRVTGTFFVNARLDDGTEAFGQQGLAGAKLAYLARNGYEIGAHGFTHRDFSRLSTGEIIRDTQKFLSHMDAWLPGYEVRSFAYPYGSLPGVVQQQVIEGFFPFTAHAWGGIARGERVNVPRIELGPSTVLARYIPRNPEENVYKGRGTRISYASGDSQLQAR